MPRLAARACSPGPQYHPDMGAVAPVPPICGREAEIGALGEALGRVAAGGPAIVLVEGEAGIGKTRLLAEALEDARGRGMQVAAGRAEELERTRPFGLLAAALGCARSAADPRRAAIAGLLGAPAAGEQGPITVTSDPGLRFRVVDAFTDLAEELALAGPLVIGLDDLQWADPSSLLTLGVLGRRLDYLPVGLIACFRPSHQTAELDRLAGALEAVGARHLVLRPLTGEAVTGLVAQAVAAEPGPRLLAQVSGAAGNPLFVTELLGALAQEGAITTAGGRAEVAETVLPPTLRLTILRRLSFLPEPTLVALRSAAILGSGFSLTDLATVTGRSAVDLSVVLAEAIRARVVEDDGARLRFRHELIRDAIYEDLAGSVRRALHREAGQRLAQAGAPALQVAEHLARGAAPGDPEAVAWLARAARQAAPRSPDVAAELLDRAVRLMAPGDPGRDRLLAERASSLMWAGRIADAETACRLAARPGPGPIPGGRGPGMPRARPAIGWTGTGQPLRAGAGMPVAPAHRRRTGRGPGVGELRPAAIAGPRRCRSRRRGSTVGGGIGPRSRRHEYRHGLARCGFRKPRAPPGSAADRRRCRATG